MKGKYETQHLGHEEILSPFLTPFWNWDEIRIRNLNNN
jgi:hypothetical protein